MSTAINLPPGLGECMASVKATLGANLRRILREKRISAASLARGISVSKQVVQSWMDGDKLPQAGNFDKMVVFLKIRPSDLFREDLDPFPSKTEPEVAFQILGKSLDQTLVMEFLESLAKSMRFRLVRDENENPEKDS